MIKLLWKSALLLLLIVVSFAFIRFLPMDSTSYVKASVTKLTRLKSTVPPRVIFVGGSNLAFGLDSAEVERQTGRQVVNMGLHAGLGMRFMLEQTKSYVGADDLIVVVPEYEQFSTTINGERFLADVVVLAPENLAYFSSRKQYVVLFKNLPSVFQERLNYRIEVALGAAYPPSEIYRADKFNAYGDLTTHLSKSPKYDWQTKEIAPGSFKPTISDEAIAVLNKFQQDAASRGAQVALIFPCVPGPLDDDSKRHLDEIYQKLKSETKIAIVSPPEKYIYPRGCFFDTAYHLTMQCREIRTRELLNDLSQFKLSKRFGQN